MGIINIAFKNYEDLKDHIKKHKPTLYISSKTSTVIPYDILESQLGLTPNDEYYLGDLSTLPKELHLEDGVLRILGGVTWQEARAFARSKGRDIMASPTEESANVLAGIATSCTGERSFAFGTLRDQVEIIIYLDYEGREKVLDQNKLIEESDLLKIYQEDFRPYEKMKNGPFPGLERETDLMIGMEGQLGIVKEIFLKTIPYEDLQYFLIPLDKWEENLRPHLDIFNKVQNFRGKILSCELLDQNSLAFLDSDFAIPKNKDIIVIEIGSKYFEEIYQDFFASLEIDPEEIIELSEGDYHHLRMDVPRLIQESNARRGVVKKGTDAQVSPENFKKLLEIYQDMGKKGIPYILFGHFGDGHLHFNFLPDKDNCEEYLRDFYKELKKIKGSPFAEHGIGLIKQDFIKPFLGKNEFAMFKKLKEKHDPYNQFFPQGFLNL